MTTKSLVLACATLAFALGCEHDGTDAKNTARNQRDRDGTTMTPTDQGESEADRTLTQRIRQGVIGETPALSMDAKNIKIITLNGHVTLRGTVNSAGERDRIDAIASSVAGDKNVDNQLEVQ